MARQVATTTSPLDPDSPIPGGAGEPDPGRTFPLSFYVGLKNTNPQRHDLTWAELGDTLREAKRTPCTLADCLRSECPHKASGKLWSPAMLRPDTTRESANVESVSLLVLDHDHLPDLEGARFAGLNGYRTLAYPTHSDCESDRCLRTINACSRSVTAAEWPRFWLAAVKLLGVQVDPKCKDTGRAYYQPTRPSDAEYELKIYDGAGADLDVEAILATAPAVDSVERTPRATNTNAVLPSDDRIDAAVRVLGGAWPNRGRHGAQLALAGALARAGWPVELVADFCAAVAEVQEPGNGSLEKRLAAARSSVEKLEGGDAVSGWPTVAEHVGSEAVDAAMRTLGLAIAPDPEFAAAMSLVVTRRAASDDKAAPDAVLSPTDAINYLNGRAAWIESVGRVAISGEDGGIEYQRVETFGTTHNNRKVKISEAGEKDRFVGLGRFWLDSPNRQSYERVGLYPPQAIAPARALNLWTGFAVDPRAGSWERMRAHIHDVIADGVQELDDYIVRWIAWMVQHPGSRAEAAIALRGDEGVGKGMLGNTLCTILGRHSIHVTNPEHFASGRFNAHMDRAVFLFADECHWPGDKKYEGNLKAMITEPKLRIEPKGIDSYEAPNRLHAMISSNGKWVVPVSIGARRFVVADVSSKHKDDHAYFGALVLELDSGGREAMLHDLLAMDLGSWHPRQIVDTQALRDQKERSLGPEDEWFLGLLDDGVLPGPCMLDNKSPAGVARSRDLEAHARATVPVLRIRNTRALIAIYKQVGAKPWRSGDPDTRTRGWQFPPLAEARATWAHTHFRRDWPPCDGWTLDGEIWTR